MRHLAGVVGEVAGDEGVPPLRADADRDVAGRVAEGGLQADLVADPVIGLDQVDQPRVPDRLHAVLEVGGREVLLGRLVGGPVIIFGATDQVSGVRERRDPGAVDPHGIPAHVIDVQVSAKHGVDAGGVEARGLEVVEKGRLQVAPLRHVALPVVADAGVNDDPLRWRLHDERVDAHLQLATVLGKVGDEPGDFPHRVIGGLGQQEAGAAAGLQLHDPGDGDVANRPLEHAGLLDFA